MKGQIKIINIELKYRAFSVLFNSTPRQYVDLIKESLDHSILIMLLNLSTLSTQVLIYSSTN